ncbi:MAG: helix-turn-helix domain-containing protein [Anaerolineales bacterium]
MDEKHERELRRKAMRLHLKGLRPRDILARIPRGRTWLHKWRQRFEDDGWAGLRSRSRRPRAPQRIYGAQEKRVIVRVRRSLEKRKVGLIGARAVQAEIERAALLTPVPSRATIGRVLQAAGLTGVNGSAASAAYYPHPHPAPTYMLHALDWISRRVQGGAYVFAFNVVDYETRDLAHSLEDNKRAATARRILLDSWGKISLPDGLQLDNDAAFCGGYRVPRVFGQIVRLCLYCGIEPIFIPYYEPERNELVERSNGLWVQAFWQKRRFRNRQQAQRCSPEFEDWYRHEYHPPALAGITPAQAAAQQPRVKLSARQRARISNNLPITAGRVHFIRKVDAEGKIDLLNEPWHVDKRLHRKYVWATVVTHEQRLHIYHRKSAKHPARLRKTVRYTIDEPVRPLRSEYRRRSRRRKMSTML